MPPNESNKSIDRDDLFLLIGSYKNTVEMYMSLLEKQNQITDAQNKILDIQNKILENQTQVISDFQKVTNELHIYTDKLKELKADISSASSANHLTLTTAIKDMTDKVDSHNLGSVKNHGTTRTRLYIALGSMVGIVGSLITMIVILADRYNHLEELLKAILKAVGVTQ